MHASLVSVVIPTYNRARYLAEAIESLLGQTYTDFEVIVVDDGSTDETPDVAARYSSEVRYVRQSNSERGAARNHGLRLARGEYVAFLDSDDFWKPDKLERDLDFLRDRPDVGLVYADVVLVDEKGRPLRTRRLPHLDGWVTTRLLRENFITLSSVLARTAAVRDAGGFREERELSGSEDWELWVRLSTRSKFAHLSVPTCCYRVHSDNSMGDAESMERSMNRALEVIDSSTSLAPAHRRVFPRARSMVALISGINHCCAGNLARARARLLEAVRHSPRILLDPRFAYTLVRTLTGPRPRFRTARDSIDEEANS